MRTRWPRPRLHYYRSPRDGISEGPGEGAGGDLGGTSPPSSGTDPVTGEGDVVLPDVNVKAPQDDFGGGGDKPTFQASNLDKPSSDSYDNLSHNMQPSDGSGSGNIQQNSKNNDAQWLRLFSLIVYGSKSDYSGGGDTSSAASNGSGNGDYGGGGDSRRRVVPFRRPGTRASNGSGNVDVGGGGDSSSSSTQSQQSSGIDLGALRCTFSVTKTTNSAPNMLYARVYNMAPATMGKVIEFTRVQVNAGYKYANYGLIFDGLVIQYRRGKETPVDTYLEIHAGDGDSVNDALHIAAYEKGTKKEDMAKALIKERSDLDSTFKVQSMDVSSMQQAIQRQRIYFGHVRNYMRQFQQEGGEHSWTDNNQYVYMKKTAYLDDEAVVLTPSTGLVGLPEVTPQGIQIRCLLNPRIKLGGIVQIDNSVLSGVAYTPGTGAEVDKNGNIVGPGKSTGGMINDPDLLGASRGTQYFETAYTSPQGRYKVCLMTISGDTRGNPWYCDMICVALDSQGNAMVGSNQSNAFLRASEEAQGSTQATIPPGDTRRRLTYVRR